MVIAELRMINMLQYHNPNQQEEYLNQVLRGDKKPIGIFLGAGCPCAIGGKDTPLIPDISGLTTAITKTLLAGKLKADFEKLCSHFVEDENLNPTIEDMLSHVRSLKQVCGKSSVRELTGLQLENLEIGLCKGVTDEVKKALPDKNTPYHKVARWIGAIRRDLPVEIFTTNYDLLAEQALEDARVPYFDGFVGSKVRFFDPPTMEGELPPRWARLWKLHGSINWVLRDGLAVSLQGPPTNGSPALIHPSHLKYEESRRMPYLAMLDRLKAFFRQESASLVICGYSFGDQHLNDMITHGLQGNATTSVFALLYGDLKTYPKAIAQAERHSSLSLLAQDEAVIGATRMKWPSIDSSDTTPHADTLAVVWKPADENKADGPKHAEFLLGDFARLGGFLGKLVSTDSHVRGRDDI